MELKPDSFSARLRSLLSECGITQAELARRSGVSESSISRYLKGSWEAKQDTVFAIAKALSVSPAYLLGWDESEDPYTILYDEMCAKAVSLLESNGYAVAEVTDGRDEMPVMLIRRGSVILSVLQNDLVREYQALADAEETPGAENLLSRLKSLSPVLPANVTPMPSMGKVPLIGTIACGTPILADENTEEYVDLPKHIRADFALTCKGDSMIGADIHDGDVVYIRQQAEIRSGQIAAVLIEDEATLKRIYFQGETVLLQPENPAYTPMIFSGQDAAALRILGLAVAFTHALIP